MSSSAAAMIFDLDGTLIDSVYQHVVAWHQALSEAGIELAIWRVHRRIGMSGGLMLQALTRELERDLDPDFATKLGAAHDRAFLDQLSNVRPLPGANALLHALTEAGVPWAIATSGGMRTGKPSLELLDLPAGAPVVTRDDVQYAKPNPDLFLAAARALGVDPHDAFVVGDSVWDVLAAHRAHAFAIGLLAGGYGADELERAGAYRVYADPLDLLRHVDELGIRDMSGPALTR